MASTCRFFFFGLPHTYLFAFRSVLRHSLDTHASGMVRYSGIQVVCSALTADAHTHTHSAGNASISSEYLCEVALATVIPSVSQLMLVKRQLNVNAQRSSIRIQNSDSFVGIIVSRFLVFDPYRQCQCQSASASTSARYRCPSHLKDLNCTAAAAFSIKNKLVPPKAKR